VKPVGYGSYAAYGDDG